MGFIDAYETINEEFLNVHIQSMLLRFFQGENNPCKTKVHTDWIVSQKNQQERVLMPLRDLTEYFNQRITEQQGLAEPPLFIKAGRVESRAGGLPLATEFHPIRLAYSPSMIVGHDATLRAFPPETSQSIATKVFHLAEYESIVNLDRLCRTIHMLNYLPISHESGYLFLHVHPRHVLGVKKNHGAYFEDVIFRCGLSPRRVVISVTISPLYDRQFTALIDGLSNYQNRGYSTAIKFDEQANESFFERYCIDLLHRITPDFVRLDGRFFTKLRRSEDAGYAKNASLLSVLPRLDTELLVEGIKTEGDDQFARSLHPSYVKGEFYDLELHQNQVGSDQSQRGLKLRSFSTQ